MAEALGSWNDGAAKQAIVDFVERAVATEVPGRGARRGVRQRRHAVVREADADPARLHPAPARTRWPRPTRRCASASPGRRPTSATTRWLGAVMAEHYAGDDTNVQDARAAASSRRTPASASRTSRRSRTRSCAARSTRRSAAATSSAPTRRWSSCSATWRPTGSPTTSPPAAAATSCGRSARSVYGIPRERVIGSAHDARVHAATSSGGTITAQAGGRLPRRRPAEADPHLEPHRPPAAARGRQLQRRHRRCSSSPSHADKPSLRAARPPRRRRARVRLHERRRAGARAGRRRRLDRRQRQGRLDHRLRLMRVARTAGVYGGGRGARDGHRRRAALHSRTAERMY